MSFVPNWVKYDPTRDELVLHGVRYSAGLFEGLGSIEPGTTLRVVNREDGVLTLERLPTRVFEEHRYARTISVLRALADAIEERGGHVGRCYVESWPEPQVISIHDLRLARPDVLPPTPMRVKLELDAWLR